MEWDYLPPVGPRPPKGFVGLKNAGATCYMNSILQQLYMLENIRVGILAADGAATDLNEDFSGEDRMEVDVSDYLRQKNGKILIIQDNYAPNWFYRVTWIKLTASLAMTANLLMKHAKSTILVSSSRFKPFLGIWLTASSSTMFQEVYGSISSKHFTFPT